MNAKTAPIKTEEEIPQNPDSHIDQDFPGFPHHPAGIKTIMPETVTEKKLAGADKKKSKKVYGN
jgi:hypothetical protein